MMKPSAYLRKTCGNCCWLRPWGRKRVMGIDPGFRTGCKVVCLDAQGNLLHNENIYPHPPVNQSKEAFAKLQNDDRGL